MESDRAGQRIERLEAFAGRQQVLGGGTVHNVAHGLDGPSCGEPFTVLCDVPHRQSPETCDAEQRQRYRSTKLHPTSGAANRGAGPSLVAM